MLNVNTIVTKAYRALGMVRDDHIVNGTKGQLGCETLNELVDSLSGEEFFSNNQVISEVKVDGSTRQITIGLKKPYEETDEYYAKFSELKEFMSRFTNVCVSDKIENAASIKELEDIFNFYFPTPDENWDTWMNCISKWSTPEFSDNWSNNVVTHTRFIENTDYLDGTIVQPIPSSTTPWSSYNAVFPKRIQYVNGNQVLLWNYGIEADPVWNIPGQELRAHWIYLTDWHWEPGVYEGYHHDYQHIKNMIAGYYTGLRDYWRNHIQIERPVTINGLVYKTNVGSCPIPVERLALDDLVRLELNKNSQSVPVFYSYQATDPLGTLYFSSNIPSGSVITIVHNVKLEDFGPSDDLPLGDEYKLVLIYGLAYLLSEKYKLEKETRESMERLYSTFKKKIEKSRVKSNPYRHNRYRNGPISYNIYAVGAGVQGWRQM